MLVPIVGPLVGAAVALLVAVLTYASAEESKIREQTYELERVRYEALLTSFDGLLVGARDREAAANFIRQIRICVLYCPDDVVRAANAFTDANPSTARCGDHACTAEDRRLLYADLVLTIRQHLFATYRDGLETTLSDADIRLTRTADLPDPE